MTFYEALHDLVRRALEEDLSGGDITSQATVSASAISTARAVAKSDLVVSGGSLFSLCFWSVDRSCRVVQHVPDGQQAKSGDVLFEVEGPSRALLMAERTALNFIQQMSGTATMTRACVTAAKGKARIVDTRKTIPGLRALQRAAVRDGGGVNHRENLGAAVMIKDNHIVAAGGITAAVERARSFAAHTSKIEVEVKNMAEIKEALAAGADILLLDNMNQEQLKAAVELAHGKALLEVSGGVTLERISSLAELGVDVISMGALTHSAPAADISLLFDEDSPT